MCNRKELIEKILLSMLLAMMFTTGIITFVLAFLGIEPVYMCGVKIWIGYISLYMMIWLLLIYPYLKEIKEVILKDF